MGTQLAIFLIFVVLAVGFHYLEKQTTRFKVCHITAKWVCSTMAVMAHPITWASLHEFFVHIFVYSGMIFTH